MNQKPLFLAVTLTALLVIGGAFCFMSKRPVAVNQPAVVDPVVETPTQTEPENPVDTSDWKTYRNEEYRFEVKYPKEAEVVYSTNPAETEEGKSSMRVVFQIGNDNKVYMSRLEKFDIEKYREGWRNLDAIAAKEGENQITQREQRLSINGVPVLRFDYCSFTLAGVDCGMQFSHYIISLLDGSYLLAKADVWQTPKENIVLLSRIIDSINFY